MPLYPMIDDRNTSPSSYEITDERAIWNRGNNLEAWRMYLGKNINGEISPYAAPARAKIILACHQPILVWVNWIHLEMKQLNMSRG